MITVCKTIFRSIRNDKILLILSLSGLTLAFCIGIPLVCNIEFHRSFDRFHNDAERISNVYIDEIYHGTKDIYGELPLAIGEYIKELFPEVESMVRTKDASDVLISGNISEVWKEDVLWVDSAFKDIFHLEFLPGVKAPFLRDPIEVCVSESLSKKIFGNSNSVGQNIKIDGKDYLISGIFKDYPRNSHLKFSILASLANRVPTDDKYKWDSYEFLTYIKPKKNTDIKEFEKKLQLLLTDYWVPWLKTNHNLDYLFNDENSIKLKLLPVTDIHLHGSFVSSFEKETDASVISINLAIILVLLIIAYFNLIGFTFSKGKKHQHQITIKRCLGASKTELIGAFIFENLIYTFIAFSSALIIIFEIWSNRVPVLADLSSFANSRFILPVGILFTLVITIAVITGYITGMFFNRISLKTNTDKSISFSRFWLNRLMIISQMASAIILMICITGIYKQLKYLSDYNIGIETKNIVIVSNGNRIGEHFETFKNELKKSPLIEEVSCSNSYPFNWMSTDSYTHANSPDQTPYPFQYFSIDAGFQKLFQFNLTRGRWFSKKYPDDRNAIIINEAAVKLMGLTSPVDEEFYETLTPSVKYHVIGVVDNFNFRSLYHNVEPLLLRPLKDGDWWRFIEIKATTPERAKVISEIKQVWNKISGNEFLDYSFFEDKIDSLYEKERELEFTIGIFCLVSILISFFGLLGTILNTTSEKTKEIGIRKINGASVHDVMLLLNIGFIKWVGISFVISCPVSFYILHKWLQNFAYRTELSWWLFFLAGLTAFGIAVLTVSCQSWRAATRNPVEALRYE
jgi:putative ABC transport system permease protein